jgi:hypothetical protein
MMIPKKIKKGRESMMETKFEIVEGRTVVDALKKVFEQGLRPATIQELWQLRDIKKISGTRWFDSGTLWVDGDFRVVTKDDDLKEIYALGGRLLFLGSNYYGLHGLDLLDRDGRFVGVTPEAQHKKKDVRT